MRLCFVNGYYDPAWSAPEQVLDWAVTMREFPLAQARAGHIVDVVQLFPREAVLRRGPVRFHFVPSPAMLRGAGRLVGRWKRRPGPSFEWGLCLASQVFRLQPEVIHYHGLSEPLNLWWLARAARRRGVPMFVHFHGGRPPRPGWRWRLYRATLPHLAGLFFTLREQAAPWLQTGLLDSLDQVVEVMETSSELQPLPRAEARARTGMSGNPVLLHAGRLAPVKDPWTMLRGFEQVRAARPGAQLYCVYLTGEMRPELEAYIDRHPGLAGSVHFLGRRPRSELAAIYSSSDFLLQASLREYSGMAVLEALSCGVVPAVTDIPSFRAMTANGQYGILFPAGQPDVLAQGILSALAGDLPALSVAVREHFERTLSYPALAAKMAAAYQSALDRKGAT